MRRARTIGFLVAIALVPFGLLLLPFLRKGFKSGYLSFEPDWKS
jgi:hypothetical protein